MQMTTHLVTDPELWNGYVDSDPAASNYHRWNWRVAIERTFGHQPYYLAACSGAAVEGVLPLFLIRSTIFGHRLVSMPFFSYGGVLAKTQEARAALLGAAVELGGRLRVRSIELRQGAELDCAWTHTDAKVTMLVRLPVQPEDVWRTLSSGMRNKIRYAEKHGLEPVWGRTELVREFYSVFSRNMRNLGTPVYPLSWFENLCRADERIRILVLRDGGAPVVSAFLVPFRDTLELPWSASLPESRKKYSQISLYWNFFQWAIHNGIERIDLGRCSRGSGTYEFKRHWNCEEVPLHWYHWLPPGASVPNLHAENPRYKWPIVVWKRLPLFAANRIGPLVAQSLP